MTQIKLGGGLWTVTVGDAKGPDSFVDAWASGVSAGWAGTFTNEGQIASTVTLGNAVGVGSKVNARAWGVVIQGDLDSFSNTGNIIASATAGSALGQDSVVLVPRVSAVELHGGVKDFLNTGNLVASVRAGRGAEIGGVIQGATRHVAGIYVSNANETTIVNRGNISLVIDAPEAKSGAKAAGIWIHNSTAVTLSNPGGIYLWNNAPGADIRTLRIENSQNSVTLADQFSIVFGQPGIDKRPIYVGADSTLNLGNANLLARIGSDLRLNAPYHLIEVAAGGTVTGEWGNLVRTFANPDLSVNWLDANRGADSAVTFRFTPREAGVAATIGAALTAVGAAQTQLTNHILNRNVFGGGFFADTSGDGGPILLASAVVSDISNPVIGQAETYKNGAFILPYFTKVSDAGMGAEADSHGVLLGLERRLSNRFTAVLTFGYGRNDIDMTGIRRGNGETQDVYSLGAFGIYNVNRWFANLSANYHGMRHDYAGRTGLNLELRETAAYDSSSLVLHAQAGPKFEGRDWGIYPSAGFRWNYWNSKSYTTEVTNPLWRKSIGSLYENWADLLIGIDASKRWSLRNKATLGLTVGAGFEHALSSNDVSIAQTMQGQIAVTTQDIANSSFTGNLAATYSQGRFRLQLGVTGQTNRDYNAYTGFARIGMAF